MGKKKNELLDNPPIAPEGAAAPAAAKAAPAAKKPKKKDKRSPLSKFRSALPGLLLLGMAVAFVVRVPIGNISSFGWQSISVICPVGALSSLLASKSFIPQAVISLVIVVLLVVVFGRAFCSWVCSVPFMQNLLGVDPNADPKAKKAAKAAKAAEAKAAKEAAKAAKEAAKAGVSTEPVLTWAPAVEAAPDSDEVWEAPAPFVSPEASACGGACGSKAACSSCAKNRQQALDSRHWVLGGALLSAAVFGFPVFCVVCPIGLTFALIFLVVRLFAGDPTWALLVVPAILLVELVVLRKWCHHFCPLGALLSLVSRANRTFVPTIDTGKCIEATTGHTCGRCAKVCPEHIDLRDLANGERGINECVRCRRCVDECPKHAISMPFLPAKKGTAGFDGPIAVGDGPVVVESGVVE